MTRPLENIVEAQDRQTDECVDAEVPEGWAKCRMGDVAQVVGGGTPTSSDPTCFAEDGHPWVTPADLSRLSSRYVSRGQRSLSDRGLSTSSARMMPGGTVVMSSRAPIGYIAVAANPLSTNQGCRSFVCQQDICPEYIYYWLKGIRDELEAMGSGTTFLEISGSKAREIPLALAPLAEQRRIVAKVEELLARVDSAKGRLARVPVILNRFRQAVLTAACSGRLTEEWRERLADCDSGAELLLRASRPQAVAEIPSAEDPIDPPEIPDSWAWSRCEYLCDTDRPITYGVIKLGEVVEKGVPTLRSSDVRWLVHVHGDARAPAGPSDGL